jgi:hypothetical protein
MKTKKKKVRKRIKKIFAHGAVRPVECDDEWVWFGASAGEEDYPVVFRMEKVPELVKWLQAQLEVRK